MNAAPPTRPPYLFFSPRCPHCNHLIELIKKNQQLARVIEPINVHTARGLPPQLDGVPAILFRGQLLVGPDTFKWVQMQTPQDNRPQGQSGMPGHPSTSGPQGELGGGGADGLDGIPLPADISSSTKTGIDFTPLPGQAEENKDTTIPRFTFLPGQGSQTDGTVGIDVAAAMEDTGERNRSSGMAQQLEQLDKLRAQDTQAINQAMGGGPYAQMQQQQAPWQAQQGGQQGGYMQQGGAPQQGGYMQQGGPPPMQQGGYMQQGGQQGSPGGYMQQGGAAPPFNQGTQYQQTPVGYGQQSPQGYGNMYGGNPYQ